MDLYCVNKMAQANGDHEVHKQSCYYLPASHNQHPLGYHRTCQEAVRAARVIYRQSNGCYWCSRECNTG